MCLGLKKGADDYLNKPFNLEELLLRVQKLIEKNERLQERNTVPTNIFLAKTLIDFKAQEAINKKNERFRLSKKETMLLKLLIENKNEVVKREKILQSVWGYQCISKYPHHR